MIELSVEQQNVLNTVIDWLGSKTRNPYLTIGGYAGTGKTTLLGFLRNELEKVKINKVAFCAYTGKAARVLEGKLMDTKSLKSKDKVSTIHSLIYTAFVDEKDNILGWDRKDEIEADLIVVDEASMVDENIWNDLLSYKIPVLAVGDHGQLPPIMGKFNLMISPMLKLEKIHRQAEGNPIISISRIVREEGKIPVKKFSNTVMKLSRNNSDTGSILEDEFYSFDENMMVLCGYNRTRIQLNRQIRSQLGFEEPTLEVGERIICLKNNHKERLVNGMLGYVIGIFDEDEFNYYVEISIDCEDKMFNGKILKAQIDSPNTVLQVEGLHPKKMGERFDRGYALTVHKAQGSQAHKVILFEERFPQMDDEQWRRWLYTGVTRAESELIIVGN